MKNIIILYEINLYKWIARFVVEFLSAFCPLTNADATYYTKIRQVFEKVSKDKNDLYLFANN